MIKDSDSFRHLMRWSFIRHSSFVLRHLESFLLFLQNGVIT
jgi:hypothetical protein